MWQQFSKKILASLGIDQRRCSHCLMPFSPTELSDKANYSTGELCPQCNKLVVPYHGTSCKLCGLPAVGIDNPANQKTANYICKSCSKNPPPWHKTAIYGIFAGPLRDLILRLKFDADLSIARVLAECLLAASGCLSKPDYIIAIPQFPDRLLQRGFNQAYEIAKKFTEMSGFSLEQKILYKKRSVLPQEQLNAAQRSLNLRDAFGATGPVSHKTIWIVDDVMTTGATMREAAKTLIQAGAREINILAVARTPLY